MRPMLTQGCRAERMDGWMDNALTNSLIMYVNRRVTFSKYFEFAEFLALYEKVYTSFHFAAYLKILSL
jgi:hypothetical protein